MRISKRFVLFGIGALLIAFIPAVYMNSAFGYLPVLVIILSIPVSLLYRELLRRNITCLEQSEIDTCQRGENLHFSVKIQNLSPLICPKAEAVFFRSDPLGEIQKATAVPLSISSFETREFSFTIPFAHVGRYKAGLKELRVFGLFGVASAVIPAKSCHIVDVVPKSYYLSTLAIYDRVNTESQRALIRSAAEEMDYAGVREYAFGDPIKMIHWKLSAHSADYLTKQMESYGASGISILMDLQLPDYPIELLMNVLDCIAETSASLCRYAQRNGMDYEILYFDKSSVKRRFIPADSVDFSQLLNDVTVIDKRPDGNTDLLRLLREELISLYGKANLAVCTANVTPELLQSLIDVKGRKRHAILFYALPDTMDDVMRKKRKKSVSVLEGAGIPYYIFSSPEDIRKAGV